jgi:hypothetical protein
MEGVRLKAFDAAEKELLSQTYDLSDWYDGEHPLLDDTDEVRARYGVRLIEAEQFGPTGLHVLWRLFFDEAGAIVRATKVVDGVEEECPLGLPAVD